MKEYIMIKVTVNGNEIDTAKVYSLISNKLYGVKAVEITAEYENEKVLDKEERCLSDKEIEDLLNGVEYPVYIRVDYTYSDYFNWREHRVSLTDEEEYDPYIHYVPHKGNGYNIYMFNTEEEAVKYLQELVNIVYLPHGDSNGYERDSIRVTFKNGKTTSYESFTEWDINFGTKSKTKGDYSLDSLMNEILTIVIN
jgi:hypothetical protein